MLLVDRLQTVTVLINLFTQELRCKEDELKQQQLHQREFEENLMKRKLALDAREIDLLGRELNIMITQNTPTPIKRRGKINKQLLKVHALCVL